MSNFISFLKYPVGFFFNICGSWCDVTCCPSVCLCRSFRDYFVIGTIFAVSKSVYRHSEMRQLYYNYLLFQLDYQYNRQYDKCGKDPVQKMMVIADMLIRESKPEDNSRDNIYHYYIYHLNNVYPHRARLHLQQQNYDAAIADYQEAIRLWSAHEDLSKEHDKSITSFYLNIGEAQLAKGDYADAVETLTFVLDRSPDQLWYGRSRKDVLCSRGYANEKLGDIEAAIKDYTETIDAMELSPAKRVETFVPREGYGKKYPPPYDIYGYEISLDELKTVRDGLLETKTATGQ